MEQNKAQDDKLELTSLHEAAIRRRYRSGKLAIGVITLMLLAFLYLLLWPFKVTELGDIVISTDPVTAGQYQRYTAGVCENPNKTARVERSLVFQGTDEAPISTPDAPERHVECTNIILIPTTIPNADYEVVLHFTYKVNPIRDALNPIERTFRSEPFTVNGGREIPLPTNIQAPEQKPDNKDSKPKDAPTNQYQDSEDATPPGGSDSDPNIQGVAPQGPAPSSSRGSTPAARKPDEDPLDMANPEGESESFVETLIPNTPLLDPLLDIIRPQSFADNIQDTAQEPQPEPIQGPIEGTTEALQEAAGTLQNSGTGAQVL